MTYSDALNGPLNTRQYMANLEEKFIRKVLIIKQQAKQTQLSRLSCDKNRRARQKAFLIFT